LNSNFANVQIDLDNLAQVLGSTSIQVSLPTAQVPVTQNQAQIRPQVQSLQSVQLNDIQTQATQKSTLIGGSCSSVENLSQSESGKKMTLTIASSDDYY
jgi:hypothetical protein